MNFLKNVFYVSLSIFCLVISTVSVNFFSLYSSQIDQQQSDKRNLEDYYLTEMEILFTDIYDVDLNGQLILSQGQVIKKTHDLENEMQKQGFNRQQINRMENEGRKVGQNARKIKDAVLNQLKTDKL